MIDIFLMVQFIRAIPKELDEAAVVDECGQRIFWTSSSRSHLPAMGLLTFFTFLHTWNDFLVPLLYMTDPNLYTVLLGLRLFLNVSETS